jgi:integrase
VEPNRFPFTEPRLTRLPKPERGDVVYHDATTRGLAVRVRPSGTRTFFVMARPRGTAARPVRATIGPFPTVTLAEARRRAAAILGDLAKGADPTQAGRRHRKASTFADLSARWLTEHAFVHKRTAERDKQALGLYLSAWNNRRVLEITRADVERLHARIGENHGRYTANRTLALLSAMFGKAIAWGLMDTNPARGIRRFPELARDRFLMPDEIKRLIGALAQETDETFQLFVLLSLLTGQRRGNVLAMRWRDIHGIDTDAPVWRIPAAEFKNGRVHVVPLVPSVVWFLRDRRREGDEFVLPGREPGQHYAEPKRRWVALLRRAELRDVRLHDLRRTFGSWQVGTGASLAMVGRALGHTTPQATAVYARFDLDPLRRSVEATADAMFGAAGLLTDGRERTAA